MDQDLPGQMPVHPAQPAATALVSAREPTPAAGVPMVGCSSIGSPAYSVEVFAARSPESAPLKPVFVDIRQVILRITESVDELTNGE
jgi:hypothetical protein